MSPRIKQFTLQDGLSQVSTNDLIRDKNGIVWIGTQDGLNRFDGNEFVHFKYSELDTNTISGNLVNRLFEDSQGQIWVGTIGNGLCYLEPNQEVFRRISLLHTSSTNEIITSIVEDDSGAIWVASRLSGLHRLQPLDNNSYEQFLFMPQESLGSLLIDDDNNLWAGTYQGQLYKIAIDGTPPLQPQLLANDLGHIQALHNTESQLLIGSDIGFFMYDKKTGKVEIIELEHSGETQTRHVLDFLVQDSTSIWIATGNGLYLFDWKRKAVVNKLENSDNINGISNNTVQSLLSLPNKEILVGTANYLNLIDFGLPHFNTISKNKKGQHLLNDNVIFSVFKDEHGLWVGTSDGGLNLIGQDGIYHITEDENIPTSIAGSVVRAIVKDTINQRLWLATTRGLSLLELRDFDPNNPHFKVFHHDPKDNNSINSDFIKDLALDGDNNLWGATYGDGVFRLGLDANGKVHITHFKNDDNKPNSLVNNFTHCIRIDRNNDIWVGTQGGLSHFEFASATDNNPVINNYFRNPELTQPLSHNSVYDILFDKSDQIWLATRHGLNLFLGSNEFKSWTAQDQFPNVVIYSIQDDNDNHLWLGTNDGLVSFNPDLEEFAHYSVADGIQSPEFDIHAKFKDKAGNIYMGGVAGLTYFNPKHLENIDVAPPLYFSKLRVKKNSANSLDNLTQKVLRPMANDMHLTFDYNQFPFYLEFSTVDFRIQKNVSFAYKLSPNDEVWNLLTDNNIQFLNLNPGQYKLQVNGFSRGKKWNKEPLEMNFTINPPWWATWWAYLVYFGIAFTAAYLFYKFSLSRKLAVAESLKLKELDILKDRFYSNITHEFRTPLTVISGMADELEININKDPNKKINLIKKSSQSLLTLVNQMLDLSKLKAGKVSSNVLQGDIISFLKYLTESQQSLANLKNVGLQFYSEEKELIMDFDSYQLEQVLNNLIGNAVKFTNEYGSILIIAKKEKSSGSNREFEIHVKDNGIGISKEQLPHIFERYHQVNPIHGNQGTGIGLALVKELMDLMNGKVYTESELNVGTTFFLKFPITHSAPVAQPTKSKEVETISRISDEIDKDIEETDYELPILLIIEDNPDVTYYLKTALEDTYRIVTSPNGKLGLENAYEILPDIIISDVMMPEMDGFEVCELLKKDDRTNHIPIILLTAKATSEDMLEGLSHGADAYLIKPFEKKELLLRMNKLMEIRKTLQAKYSAVETSEISAGVIENSFVKRFYKIIEEHITDDDFSIEDFADSLHLSRSQVHRKIKGLTGMSTSLYIRHIRLQKAKTLLTSTDLTVSEIAYQTGFKTPVYFSKVFKESIGVSPSEARKTD